jgi:hypothetical protein
MMDHLQSGLVFLVDAMLKLVPHVFVQDFVERGWFDGVEEGLELGILFSRICSYGWAAHDIVRGGRDEGDGE